MSHQGKDGVRHRDIGSPRYSEAGCPVGDHFGRMWLSGTRPLFCRRMNRAGSRVSLRANADTMTY